MALALTLAGVHVGVSQSADEVVGDVDRLRLETLIAARRSRLPYMPGELLVKFRPGTSPAAQSGALRVLRSQPPAANAEWIGDTLHISGLIGEDPKGAAMAVARQPEVLFAEPNYVRRLHGTPNDPGFQSQWHMELINMPKAWEINARAAEGVVVAVIDSGLTTVDGTFGFRLWTGFAFPTFPVPFVRTADFDHSRVRPGAEFLPFGTGWRSASGQPLLFDAGGHGTHVAGTIAQQTNNASGYAGIANGATLLPVKTCFQPWDVQLAAGAVGLPGWADEDLAGCATTDIVRGIHHAVDSGAKVINLSLGSPDASQTELDALRYAVQRGVFVTIAAGNEASSGNPISYPAAHAPGLDGVIAVGAVTRNATRAVYSNYGSYVEIVAPGGAGTGASENIWQIHPNTDDLSLFRQAPAFSRYSGRAIAGTSMAAPHVAGVAALLFSQGMTKPAVIEAAMERFSRDLGSPGRDDEYGYGLIDARATLLGLGVPR